MNLLQIQAFLTNSPLKEAEAGCSCLLACDEQKKSCCKKYKRGKRCKSCPKK